MTNTPKPEGLASLVERLNAIPVWMVEAMTPGWQDHGTTAYEAATTITTLAAERDALKALLKRGVGFVDAVHRGGHWIGPSWGDETNLWRDLARTTLERTAQP